MFDNHRLERRLERVERKLDLIMRRLDIQFPPPADDAEIGALLSLGKKIQAIKLYRDLNPSASLKEAKDAVEARAAGRN